MEIMMSFMIFCSLNGDVQCYHSYQTNRYQFHRTTLFSQRWLEPHTLHRQILDAKIGGHILLDLLQKKDVGALFAY